VDHRTPRSTFVIACVASLVPKKGHRILLEACALLSQRGIKGLQCLIIGDGPCEKEIRRQITETGLEGVVQLVGRLPHGDVMDMYQRGEADLVVLPSLVAADGQKEGIPVALMEAMAYGIPVVSTTTGGIPELLHGGAGVLVPPASPPDLAEAIGRLINDRDLRVAVGAQGRARVREQFDVVLQAQTLVRMIQAPECTRAALRGVEGQV
jgi:glycosyltransferase involved in cell wall biosynthesis